MLSKTIVQYFVQNLSLEELRCFHREVLIPQKAKCLSEHVLAAENILLQQSQTHENHIQEVKDGEAALTRRNG